jgi:hypothetical protein
VFALLGLGFPIWVIRRRREAAADDADQGTTTPPDELGSPAVAVTSGRGPAGTTSGSRPTPRTRRHHVWDDEDE